MKTNPKPEHVRLVPDSIEIAPPEMSLGQTLVGLLKLLAAVVGVSLLVFAAMMMLTSVSHGAEPCTKSVFLLEGKALNDDGTPATCSVAGMVGLTQADVKKLSGCRNKLLPDCRKEVETCQGARENDRKLCVIEVRECRKTVEVCRNDLTKITRPKPKPVPPNQRPWWVAVTSSGLTATVAGVVAFGASGDETWGYVSLGTLGAVVVATIVNFLL